ncbi:nucleolar and spindle-associated protein 1 [Pogona vitticeps]
MEVPTSEQLETLKYSELQRLAKVLGLRANLKANKLLNVLKQHVHEPMQETRSMDTETASLSTDYEEYESSEIITELNETEGSQDAGSPKTQSSVTLRNPKEKNCTMQERVESKTPVDYLPGTELCYSGSLSRSRKRRINSTTPNFKKLHEAQFKKMQSIDDYMENKNKRIHNFNNSVNKTKVCSSGFLLSPHPQKHKLSSTCTPINLRRTPHNSRIVNKNSLSQKSAFISTGFSATKMNVRFSESTKDNEHKRSLTKTPSRKSPFLNSCNPGSQKSNKAVTRKKCTGSATKYPIAEAQTNTGVTPSKVIPGTPAPLNTKKPVFDLQASLSRPLNYQPHKGKLKPWGKSKENHQGTCSHRRSYKQPLLQSREERREKHARGRKQRKDQVLETRRGLAVI